MLTGDIQDYIHAVAVNVWKFFIVELLLPLVRLTNFISIQGYKQQRAFIIAQSPMQSTVRDFWKMIHDWQCGVIVMLCHLTEADQVG